MNKNELDITRAVTNQNLTINENWVDDAYYDTNSKIFPFVDVYSKWYRIGIVPSTADC